MPTAEGTRCFLFLQGHPSSFSRRLANALEQEGHRIKKINFCVGDQLFWFPRKAYNYRGRSANWPAFLKDYIKQEQITDIIYYGDRRPYHVVACAQAQEAGIQAFAYEFGYLRPDWITFEKFGMGQYSHFPNDPETISKIAHKLPEPDMLVRSRFTVFQELFNEITYNLSTYFLFFMFPYYNSDWYYDPLFEYIRGIPSQLLAKRRDKAARRIIEQIKNDAVPYYLAPLQLQNDYQLRANATFKHQSEVIELTITSFAHNAPKDAKLVFKCHPLDNDYEGWPAIISKAAIKNSIKERVIYIRGGDLLALLKQAKGTVLVNSTVGLHSMNEGCPVKVLGAAVYDIPGLTQQSALDGFWRDPKKPDPDLLRDFTIALAGTVQVKGNFFTEPGQSSAIKEIVERLSEGRVNGAGAFIDPAPRLPGYTKQAGTNQRPAKEVVS